MLSFKGAAVVVCGVVVSDFASDEVDVTVVSDCDIVCRSMFAVVVSALCSEESTVLFFSEISVVLVPVLFALIGRVSVDALAVALTSVKSRGAVSTISYEASFWLVALCTESVTSITTEGVVSVVTDEEVTGAELVFGVDVDVATLPVVISDSVWLAEGSVDISSVSSPACSVVFRVVDIVTADVVRFSWAAVVFKGTTVSFTGFEMFCVALKTTSSA